MENELNGLGYVSSAPDLLGELTVNRPRDEAEISTLEEVLKLIRDRKRYYESIESLSLDDKTFTIEEQLAINKRALFHIQEIEGMGDDVPDFRGAFVEEMTGEPEAPEVEEVEEKPDTEVEDAEVEKTEEKVEKTEEEAAEGEEEKKKEDEEEEDDKPEFATKQDIEDALRRNQDASVEHVNNVVKARDEIIEKLHPEGVDTNVYDTNGEIVKTAQDIVDRGLVKANGEPFTYEEAASYMLEAGRQSAENIQKLQDYATEVAEQNISLYESNQRVIEKWGDVLNTMPNLRTNLAKEYMETQLEFDPTGSYITKMHSTPERFYALTVGPYVELAEALANKEAAQAQEQARSQQDEQAERTGLPPQRGQAAVKSNTGDPMLDALIDEMNS
jgi:hypothetical protein